VLKVAVGEGDGVATSFAGVGAPLGAGVDAGAAGLDLRSLSSKNGVVPLAEGVGDCATSSTASIEMTRFSSKRRGITMVTNSTPHLYPLAFQKGEAFAKYFPHPV